MIQEVGCGIAGFTDEEIAPLFAEALNIPNISIPKVIKIRVPVASSWNSI